ncbi:MAG: hypothetical protein ACFFBH_10325 [Promethearchaeota archaeon]
MVNESKAELYKKLQAEYHKNLKELESDLATLHKELHQVEQGIKHEEKKIYGISNYPTLKARKAELDALILKLKKRIKNLHKDKIKKIKKLKKS